MTAATKKNITEYGLAGKNVLLLQRESIFSSVPSRDIVMKFNDPFGRMESRHQQGYESMRETMRNNGIDTPKAAREIIHQSKKRALQYMAIVLAVLLPATWLIPRAMPLTLSLALFLIVWIASSAINGQRYIRRYIDEDLTP